jgi:DNA polymerase alpha-associated DNA helicase A
VDNILERILALPGDPDLPKLKATRIGHPARVLASNESVLGATLDLQAARSDEVLYIPCVLLDMFHKQNLT